MEPEFTSDNPIIQKCLDVLDNPKVKIRMDSDLIYAYFRGDKVFGVGRSGILFIGSVSYYDCDKYYGMSFWDIHKIWNKAERLYNEDKEKEYGEARSKILGYLDKFVDKKSKSDKLVRQSEKIDEILPSRWEQIKQFFGIKIKKSNELEY